MQMEATAGGPSAAAAPSFPEEHCVVLDRWLYDVCGDDGLQFPSHRRAQYAAFVAHCRGVRRLRQFLAGTFSYPSRLGTREVLALQAMLTALAAHSDTARAALRSVENGLAATTKGAFARRPTAGEETKDEDDDGEDDDEGDDEDDGGGGGVAPRTDAEKNHNNHHHDHFKNEDDDAGVVDRLVETREGRRALYAQKRRLAQRYADALQRATADLRARRSAVAAQHQRRLREKGPLDTERAALALTEQMVLRRHDDTAAQCETARAALAAERAAWAACCGGDAPQSDGAAEAGEVDRTVDSDASAHPPTELSTSEAVSSGSEAEQERQAALERLRARLSEAGAALHAMKRQLLNGEQIHSGRFKVARQRLKDWQDVVAAVRRTHHQLRGQVKVLSTVVQDTAERLAANTTAAEEAGYLAQVHRFNALLAERSYETLHAFMGEADTAATATTSTATTTTTVKPLTRPAPTPVRASPGDSGETDTAPSKHRSRYDLVRHLQRWESALQTERAQLLEAAGMNVSDRTTGENTVKPVPDGPLDARTAHQRQKLIKLQKLLLQSK